MNPRLTLLTASRVLQQIRADHRTVALLLIVPCVLMGLLGLLIVPRAVDDWVTRTPFTVTIGDVVALALQPEREGRPHAAAAHDDKVHGTKLHRDLGRRGCVAAA